MENLDTYIESINGSKTPQEAFERYCRIMNKFGYDRIVYSLMTDHPSLQLPRQHGLASTYPQHYVAHYNSVGYMDHDPVAKELLRTTKPFFWNDLMQSQEVAPMAAQVMNEASESGIHDGLAFAMPGKFGEVTACGLARMDKDSFSKKNDYITMACIHLISVFFHDTFRQMHQEKEKERINLTERETEILLWAAEGKSDDTISDILNISSNTVRFHWKNIFTKLDAHGRVFAVIKALRMDLIKPISLRSSSQSYS
jgi:DNA-binding CsgD family transcriptional regulator